MYLAVFPDARSVLLARRHSSSGSAATHSGTAAPGGSGSPGVTSAEDGSDGASGLMHLPAYTIPTVEDLKARGLDIPQRLWGYAIRDGEPVSGVFLDPDVLSHLLAIAPTSPDDRFSLEVISRRQAADLMQVDDYWHMNRAFHLADWDRNTVFCGRCAAPMTRSETEISKRCSVCNHESYPQIAPAVIMAVVREGRILLANNKRRPGTMYSVLAGFVEAGETLEGAVTREVFEEAGIIIRNVEYFSSQPWPFPNSLMVAFTAEYASGELTPDEDEIEEIAWYLPSEIPANIPSAYSVARRLIEWFVSEYGTDDDLRRVLESGVQL